MPAHADAAHGAVVGTGPPPCSRCHVEPALPRHRDGLGRRCVEREIYGEEE
jgi:hypothetical protein